jgi:vancomycin permeability regulator SanA
MEFAFNLGFGGWLVLVVGALVFGGLVQFLGQPRASFEWVATAIGAAIGAVVASEFIVGWQAFQPVWEGLALVPALVGGLVVGTAVEVATRSLTGGTYSGRPTSA